MHDLRLARRRLLLASLAFPTVTALPGCTSPLPPIAGSTVTPEAQALLERSAEAHGYAAFSTFTDISVGYIGEWAPRIARIQPLLVDEGFRGGSEERLLLRDFVVAQAHTGPEGKKQVVRRIEPAGTGSVRVWFNGTEAPDRERLDPAALVVDGYNLFLLGPLLLLHPWAAERVEVMGLGEVERITVDGREHQCDVLQVRMAPGIGFSESEQLALFIDREERLMRRVRLSLDGLESTKGAIADVDTFDHVTRDGVRWPTRFIERLLRPFPLAVHDWRMTGVDVNRGLAVGEVDTIELRGKSVTPAATTMVVSTNDRT